MENIVKMPHIRFKPTKRIEFDFHPSELDVNSAPEESKIRSQKYLKSNDLHTGAILIMYESEVVFGFDHLNKNEKIIIPEINPVTIFFSNAVMFHRLLCHSRSKLLANSSRVKGSPGKTNPNDFGNFFQAASSIIINLQATIESFANRLIPKEKEFIGKDGKLFEPSISHKLNTVLPEIKGEKFKTKFGKQNNYIRQLTELRNDIVHLKPAGEINSGYKTVYRRMINFKYTETILAVRTFVEFYEPGLIEECPCQKEYFYGTDSIK